MIMEIRGVANRRETLIAALQNDRMELREQTISKILMVTIGTKTVITICQAQFLIFHIYRFNLQNNPVRYVLLLFSFYSQGY